MRHSFFGLACFLICTVPAVADDLDDGLNAYDAERYDEAVALLTPLAEAGTIEAQLALANIYNFGFGVPVDQAAAFHWLSLAAERNDPDALYNVATMSFLGAGTEPDPDQGLRLLHRAAELNSSDALYALGMLALQDAPQTGDVDTGLGYLAHATYLGNRRAPAMIGVLLQELPEVEQNLVKSALNFQVAIARGCDDVHDEAVQAIARLSAEQRETYEYNLPGNLVMTEQNASVHYDDKAHCLR